MRWLRPAGKIYREFDLLTAMRAEAIFRGLEGALRHDWQWIDIMKGEGNYSEKMEMSNVLCSK